MVDTQRLRDLAETLEGDDWQHPLGSAQLCRAAADEVERLRKVERRYEWIKADMGIVGETQEGVFLYEFELPDFDPDSFDNDIDALLEAAKGGAA